MIYRVFRLKEILAAYHSFDDFLDKKLLQSMVRQHRPENALQKVFIRHLTSQFLFLIRKVA